MTESSVLESSHRQRYAHDSGVAGRGVLKSLTGSHAQLVGPRDTNNFIKFDTRKLMNINFMYVTRCMYVN